MSVKYMIPKLIHLCWFSGDEYPEDIKFCLDSWKNILPDFQVKVWTKEMALATGIDFVKEAISVKMWAFAADVIRLYAVYYEGGVYMDSDIYVQRRFDEFMEKRCAFFQEYSPSIVKWDELDEHGHRLKSVQVVQGVGIQAALFMSEPGNTYLKELLDDYEGKHFILEDGTYNISLLAPAVYALKAEPYGYKYLNVGQCLSDDLIIYPASYVASGICLREDANFAVHCIGHSWFCELRKQAIKKEPWTIRIKIFIYRLYCQLTGKPAKEERKSFKEKLEEIPARS